MSDDEGAGYELYKLWLGSGSNYWQMYSDQHKQRWDDLADAMADVVRIKVNEATGVKEGLDSLSDRLYVLADQGDFHLKDDPVTPPVTVSPKDYVEPRGVDSPTADNPVDTTPAGEGPLPVFPQRPQVPHRYGAGPGGPVLELTDMKERRRWC